MTEETQDIDIVVPGDLLDEGDGELREGQGTYKIGRRIYAMRLGVKRVRANYVNVMPVAGEYIPRQDDLVIGKIIDIGPSTWSVDLNSPYVGTLHVNDTPWRVDYGGTARYLTVGDIVLVKIDRFDEIKRVQITMKGSPGLRKLAGGLVIDISVPKIQRVIGKSGTMISLIKRNTGCGMFVGQNGRIWIDGEPDLVSVVTEAIKIIEAAPIGSDLDSVIELFLSDKRRGSDHG